MTQAEIAGAFATFGVVPIERDMRELRELIRGPVRRHDGVLYRTVLTNGTAMPTTGAERQDAELERDAS